MEILKKLLNYIKRVFRRIKFILSKDKNKDYCLKVSNEFLKRSIKQTSSEFASFDYERWKLKYKDELFYFLFEQLFRGSSDTIKRWQRIYLDYVKDAYKINKDKIWLDIGCGRGEFISLLKEENISYLGLDINSVNVDICLEKGLNIIKRDALEYLENIPDNSLCGISALQVIEHLDREKIKKFLYLCYEKISDGGKLIIETVNIRNKIAFKNYFMDPTHNLPVMPEFLEMFLEFVGFKEVFVLYLTHNYCENLTNPSSYPDYAVIATK